MAVTGTENTLVAPVVDGKVNAPDSPEATTEKKPGSTLGKDDFLLLLTTQMKYQDPLNPQSDPEFVAQLAQFSALEEMQNLNSTTVNSQAFGLVGKEVVINTESGNPVQGAVEFVTIRGGETMLSVNGNLYNIDDLTKVYDESYLISTYLPSVEAATITYSHYEPKDVSVKVNLGSNGYQASAFAVNISNDKDTSITIDKKYLTYKDGTLVIDKKAFGSLKEGDYNLSFVFNDPLQTGIGGKVTVKIKGTPYLVDNGQTGKTEGSETTDTEGNGEDNDTTGGTGEAGSTQS